MLEDAARLLKQERARANHQQWVSAQIVADLEEYGFTASDVLRSIARHPTWEAERVAMRLLHSVAFALPLGTLPRRNAFQLLTQWAAACNESAQVYQRAFFQEDCFQWQDLDFITGAEVKVSPLREDDPECTSRASIYPIREAMRNPPLPCEKPYCYCYLSPVFSDDRFDLDPTHPVALPGPTGQKMSLAGYLVVGGAILYMVLFLAWCARI